MIVSLEIVYAIIFMVCLVGVVGCSIMAHISRKLANIYEHLAELAAILSRDPTAIAAVSKRIDEREAKRKKRVDF